MKSDRRTNRFHVPLGLALLGCAIFATSATEAAQRKVLMENFEADW
jgi:hypothetical protein